MESFQLKPVRSAGEIEAMCAVAERVWHLTYDELLAPGQVDYMVEMFQSPQAVEEQMAQEGYQYYSVCQGEQVKGFVGFSPRYQGRDELFLSKVYLLPEIRGKGAVRQVFRFVEEEARRQGLPTIRLTVNKGNAHAAQVYEHYGFQVTDSVVTDIGGGYVMDDYVMEKVVG